MTVELALVTLSSELLDADLHLRHRLRVGWSGKGGCKASDRRRLPPRRHCDLVTAGRIETAPAAAGQVHLRPCIGGRMVTRPRRVLCSMWMRRTVGLITSPVLLLG
jgi:hypothetical protein